MSKFKNSRVKL